MRLGVRGKLFLVSVGVILAVGLVSGIYAEVSLRDWLESGIEAELLSHAHAARELLEETPASSVIEEVDPRADRIASASGALVTVVGADGRVLGDSGDDAATISRYPNYRTHPEIAQALAEGQGIARRYSTTVHGDMVYVAVPYGPEQHRGVVRLAMPLEEVEVSVARLRVLLLVAGLIGLGVAIFMSGLASHFFSRTLRELVAHAQTTAFGEGHVRDHADPPDELGWLAGSLDAMAGDFQRLVKELAAERDRFEAVVEGMEEAVIALDRGQRITLLNRCARSMLRLDESVLGRPMVEVLRIPALFDLISRLDGKPAHPVEVELPGLERRVVLVRAAPLKATGGAVVVIHDITRLRHLETVRRDFVANVSHELRTPVSVVRASAETLLEGALEEEAGKARTFVDAIFRNAERLSRMIADLLDITRIESGQYPLRIGEVSVSQVANRVARELMPIASLGEVALSVAIDVDAVVAADPKALEQILNNLVENAVKYTPRGGRVEVSVRGSGHDVRIEVKDNGPGIQPAHRERIFERFYRADTGRSRDMGGTGLGLSIVKNLATAMGGRVGVAPAEPYGSIFWVELPRVVEEPVERSGTGTPD